MENKKFYIATAIVYASQKPHYGNDFDLVLADAIARYKRSCGYDVFFSTGTDEHGQKIEDKSREAGVSPKEYTDGITSYIIANYKSLGITYDKFIRTTDPEHKSSVSAIFKRLYEQGDIYKGEYEGMYCVPCESFFTPSQIETEGICPDCGRELKHAKEPAYRLKLSKYQEWLEKYIEDHPGFIVPESRRREIVNNFIKPGVQDLCVSRSTIKWGIPVEFDPGNVIYVWIDALSNYITTLGYHPDKPGADLFTRYWPCDLHVIGKDILRFHAIYWPVMLHALGLPMPKKILGHPWLLFGADKMSKSKGNVVYSGDITRRFGSDAARYYLLREIPFAADGSFTYENFLARYNAELVNTFGNLVSRTTAMTEKYFGGILPETVGATAYDAELTAAAGNAVREYTAAMEDYKTSDALGAVMEFLRRANKYIDETTPWILAKNPDSAPVLAGVLYNLLESIRLSAVMLSPAIPEASEKVFGLLGTAYTSMEDLAFGKLARGVRTGVSGVMFARADEEAVLAEIAAERAAEPAQAVPVPEDVQPEIEIGDFMKTELRAALVTACEKVEKSDKLLKLQLDLGYETRQIVSGIAQSYAPQDLVGKKIIVVANLKPAVIRGVESCGMLLAGGDPPAAVFCHPDTPPGTRIR